MKMKSTGNGNVAGFAVLVLCLLALIGMAFYALMTGQSLEPIGDIKTDLSSVVLLLIGYFWGSSKGSKEKTELLRST